MNIINFPQKLNTHPSSKIMYLGWNLVERAILLFTKKIHLLSSVDGIFVLIRGGMVPAVMLAHKLNVRKMFFYQGLKTQSNTPHDYGIFRVQSVPKICKGMKYLVVEDIIFEGDTVVNAIKYIQKRGGICVGVCSLVIDVNFYNIAEKLVNVPVICAYKCSHLKWIRFPWENSLDGERRINLK